MKQDMVIIEGRKYQAYVSPDEQQGAHVIIGPPEGLVDNLGIPEPFATTLHNILHDRGIFTYQDAAKRNVLIGALQEAYTLEAQRILEEFGKYETEAV